MDISTNAQSASSTKRGRGCGCWIALILFLAAGGGITTLLGATFALRQETPLEPEAAGADLAKRWIMIEPQYTDWQMPEKYRNAEAVNAGKDLFTTECAMCHGAAGKGDAILGKTQFPPAANLASDRTQSKTDGQLWWLIWHGVNYTGMPAWGKENGGSHDQAEIWNLVSYIRSIKGK